MQTLRLLTANLRHGGHTHEGNVWQRLLGECGSDLVCTQESRPPEDYANGQPLGGSQVFRFAPGRRWGSAVWSRSLALQPLVLEGFEGHVTGARVRGLAIGREKLRLECFSVHIPGPAPYVRHVERLLEALAARRGRAMLVLAGDFNITVARRHASEALRHTAAEERMLTRLRRELGVTNAWQVLHPNRSLPQTLRWSTQPRTPYHCDGVFVDCRLLPFVQAAEVLSAPHWNELTDHNPVQVDFSLPAVPSVKLKS